MTKRRPLKPSAVAMVLACLLAAQVILSYNVGVVSHAQAETSPDVYVGVYLGYGLSDERGYPMHKAMIDDAKALIDKVSPYTNLFVLGSTAIGSDATLANETLQYAYEKGLYFVTFSPRGWDYLEHQAQWYEYANNTWGNRLLGFYTLGTIGDEPGGRQLDSKAAFDSAYNNTDASSKFLTRLEPMFEDNPNQYYVNFTMKDYPRFTSDYGLYWFDYKAGYDVIFTQFILGSNNQLAVALCRGAATALNKEWGVVVTYGATFEETGNELFNDMILAYDNGAKYIVVFDSNPDHSGGSLKPEHFQAIQQFWQYIHQNPRKNTPMNQRVAYVLPKDYGVGLRWRDERIWGLFDADNVSVKLYDDTHSLLGQYGAKLDIVYDDGLQLANNGGYNQLIYWNSYNASSSPSPQEPTTTPNQTVTLPQEAYYVIGVAAVAILVIATVTLFQRKRLNKETA